MGNQNETQHHQQILSITRIANNHHKITPIQTTSNDFLRSAMRPNNETSIQRDIVKNWHKQDNTTRILIQTNMYARSGNAKHLYNTRHRTY